MATPASGAISMNDMRTHINRATSSAISMDEMRTRFGGSGAISFSDLYKCEGFIVSPADFNNKFLNADGWSYSAFGSVTPNEANGMVQFAANSYVGGMYALDGTNNFATMYMYNDPSGTTGPGWTSGFAPSNTTRIVTANTSRSITGVDDSSGTVNFTYDWPSTGTIHCLVKF